MCVGAYWSQRQESMEDASARDLEAFVPADTGFMRDALARLPPVLRALDGVVGSITGEWGSA